MTQPESRLSAKIQAALRKEGAFVFKIHGDEHMMTGLPDIVGCYRGLFFGFETKMPGRWKNTSKRQDYVHERIQGAGGYVVVVTSIDEAVGHLRMMIQRSSG